MAKYPDKPIFPDELYNSYKDARDEGAKNLDKLPVLSSLVSRHFDSFFNEKTYSISETHSSYKIINDWTRLGIIEDNRDDKGQWRKFSLVDLVWVKIVNYLRKISYPLEKIKLAKQYYYQDYIFLGNLDRDEYGEILLVPAFYKINGITYPEIQFYLLEIFMGIGREEFDEASILIYPEEFDETHYFDKESGEYEELNMDSAIFEIRNIGSSLLGAIRASNFVICINLNDLVKGILFESDKVFDDLKNTNKNILDLEEYSNYDQVNLKFKNKDLSFVEIVEKLDPKTNISKLINSGDYQDFEIKQEKGKIQMIKRKIKKKL